MIRKRRTASTWDKAIDVVGVTVLIAVLTLLVGLLRPL
jgi:hypothetical protein